MICPSTDLPLSVFIAALASPSRGVSTKPKPSDALVRVLGHVTRGGFEIAAKDLHERRFSATIGADQAVAIAVGKLDRYILEQGRSTKLHGDIGGDKHDVSGLKSADAKSGSISDESFNVGV
jgi:hypothetical protein